MELSSGEKYDNVTERQCDGEGSRRAGGSDVDTIARMKCGDLSRKLCDTSVIGICTRA